MGPFYLFSAFRGQPRGRKAASKPKRAAVRGSRPARGGSGRACHAPKVLPRHCQIQQKKFNVLYSCQGFEAFLGRPAAKGGQSVGVIMRQTVAAAT